jgi:hypothetical protein
LLVAGTFDFALAAEAAFEFKFPGTDAEEVGRAVASPFSVLSQVVSAGFPDHPDDLEVEGAQEEEPPFWALAHTSPSTGLAASSAAGVLAREETSAHEVAGVVEGDVRVSAEGEDVR